MQIPDTEHRQPKRGVSMISADIFSKRPSCNRRRDGKPVGHVRHAVGTQGDVNNETAFFAIGTPSPFMVLLFLAFGTRQTLATEHAPGWPPAMIREMGPPAQSGGCNHWMTCGILRGGMDAFQG